MTLTKVLDSDGKHWRTIGEFVGCECPARLFITVRRRRIGHVPSLHLKRREKRGWDIAVNKGRKGGDFQRRVRRSTRSREKRTDDFLTPRKRNVHDEGADLLGA